MTPMIQALLITATAIFHLFMIDFAALQLIKNIKAIHYILAIRLWRLWPFYGSSVTLKCTNWRWNFSLI